MAKTPSDKKAGQIIDGETGKAETPPPGKPARRIDLSTLRDVRIELGHVYRKMDSGELDHADGTKRAFVLQTIAKVIEAAELEHRLAALEDRLSTPGARLPAPTYAAH